MADAPSKKPKGAHHTGPRTTSARSAVSSLTSCGVLPADTPFRQQNLKAWRPILTPNLVILLFLIVGVVFIPIGVAVLSASNDVSTPGSRLGRRVWDDWVQ